MHWCLLVSATDGLRRPQLNEGKEAMAFVQIVLSDDSKAHGES